MQRALYSIAAMLASASAFHVTDDGKIVYPDWVDVDDVRVDPEEYPMIFRWPREGPRCGATMITDQIALTAAHCVEEEWDRTDPRLTVQLADGQVYGIQEIRANECWDFGPRGNEYSADIAIMIFDRPIANAVEGIHYLKMYDPDTMGTEVGQEFMLAGWGTSGQIQSNGREGHYDRRMQILHRGYNHIERIRDNLLIYTVDRPSNGGHDLEVSGHRGDSGSGALIEVDGELYIAGVLSHGQIPVGIGTFGAYTRVGGYHLDWIEDNLNINRRVPAEGCGASVSDREEIIDDSRGCRNTNGPLNTCDVYERRPEWCGRLDDRDFVASLMCCACGGGQRDSVEDDNDDDNNDEIDEEQEEEIEGEEEIEEEEEDEDIEEEQEDEIIDDGQDCRDIDDRINACDIYDRVPEFCGRLDSRNFVASERCCACGGGQRDSVEEDDDNENDDDIEEEPEEEIEEEPEEEIDEGPEEEIEEEPEEEIDEGPEEEIEDEQEEEIEEEQEEEIEEEQEDQVEDEQEEEIEEEQDDDQIPIDCYCECDPDDFACWETCYVCLDPIFGDDEESQDEEQTPEPEGLDCEDVCDCDFEEMMCWEECHACLDPHFGDVETIEETEETKSVKQEEQKGPKSTKQDGTKSVSGKKN